MRRRIFPEDSGLQGRPWSELPWSLLKELGDSASLFQGVGERVFPFQRERTAQSFCVPKEEIAARGHDLSLKRAKELVHEEVDHRLPLKIRLELRAIEHEILQGIEELKGMLRCSGQLLRLVRLLSRFAGSPTTRACSQIQQRQA